MRLGKEQAVGYVEDTAAENTVAENLGAEDLRADAPVTAEVKTGPSQRMSPVSAPDPALPVA
jgi:hypothetical protein